MRISNANFIVQKVGTVWQDFFELYFSEGNFLMKIGQGRRTGLNRSVDKPLASVDCSFCLAEPELFESGLNRWIETGENASRSGLLFLLLAAFDLLADAVDFAFEVQC